MNERQVLRITVFCRKVKIGNKLFIAIIYLIYKAYLTAYVRFYKMILGWFTHSKIRMTIQYSREVFTTSGKGLFLHLLNRWKGSIYKLVWRDLLVYVSIYTALSLVYRFKLSEEGKLVITINFPFWFKRELKVKVIYWIFHFLF